MELTYCPKCRKVPHHLFYLKKCTHCDPPPQNQDGLRPLMWEALKLQSITGNPRNFDAGLLYFVEWLDRIHFSSRSLYVDDEAREVAKRISLWT